MPLRVESARRTYFVPAAQLPLLEALAAAEVEPRIFFLPPLDNVLWRRERLLDLFGFDYTREIYVPEVRRRFGPYAMPILEGDALIGRLDPRLERERGILHVRRLVLEPGVAADRARAARISAELHALAGFLGASSVCVGDIEPHGWRLEVEAADTCRLGLHDVAGHRPGLQN